MKPEILTARETTILRALVDRIIPPDDYPGGWEGGVGDYLERQFEGDLAPLREFYRLGLASLDAEAQAIAGMSFDELTPDASDALLQQIESGKVQTPWMVEPTAFFDSVTNHCAEGFYSDPGNGGNRDQAAWRMVGFEVRG